MRNTALAITVDGVDQVQTDLRELVAGLADLGVMADVARQAADLASSFAPRRTGRLAAAIRGSKAKNSARVRAGGARVPYAAVQNYGWPRRNIPATHYMQRADRVMQGRVPAMLDEAIDQLIRGGGLS